MEAREERLHKEILSGKAHRIESAGKAAGKAAYRATRNESFMGGATVYSVASGGWTRARSWVRR